MVKVFNVENTCKTFWKFPWKSLVKLCEKPGPRPHSRGTPLPSADFPPLSRNFFHHFPASVLNQSFPLFHRPYYNNYKIYLIERT